METFLFAINAIMPIIILIALGYFLKRVHLLSDDFIKYGNKIVFRVALPVVLFLNIYNIESISNIRFDVTFYAVGVVLVLILIGFFVALLFVKDDRQKGVIMQSAFRPNFLIIGLPVAGLLMGSEAEEIASVISAFCVPIFNIFSVIALSIFIKDSQDKTNEKKISQFLSILKNIVTNPLIIGVVSGLVFLGIRELFVLWNISFRMKDIEFLYTSLTWIKKMTTPLALIILGGRFEFSAVKRLSKQIVLGTFLKIVLGPLIGLSVAYFFKSFDGNCFAVLIGLFCSPIAVASAVMASEMKNDDILAGQLVVWTTVFSTISIFIATIIFKGIGVF